MRSISQVCPQMMCSGPCLLDQLWSAFVTEIAACGKHLIDLKRKGSFLFCLHLALLSTCCQGCF